MVDIRLPICFKRCDTIAKLLTQRDYIILDMEDIWLLHSIKS